MGRGRWGCVFCQAEDGIRATSVTGVQTCALPISTFADPAGVSLQTTSTPTDLMALGMEAMKLEVGRASCRERVESGVGGGGGKEKRDRGRVHSDRMRTQVRYIDTHRKGQSRKRHT